MLYSASITASDQLWGAASLRLVELFQFLDLVLPNPLHRALIRGSKYALKLRLRSRLPRV